MKKNVAGQFIGAQMVNATTGAAFTAAVTVAVTGNAGTQTTGSVGGGACTHEGNGFHTYAPAQAETNFDHIAFTFTGTGSIPTTIQVFPSFPQSADDSVAIANIQTRLPAALVGGRMDSSAGAIDAAAVTSIQSGLATSAALATVSTKVDTVDDFVDTEITALTSAVAAVDTKVTTVDGKVTTIGTNVTTIDGKVDVIDDLLDTEIATIAANVVTIMGKTNLIPGTMDGKTLTELLTLMGAAMLGKASGMATTTAVYRAVNDSKARITATVDANGNRSAVTLDAA